MLAKKKQRCRRELGIAVYTVRIGEPAIHADKFGLRDYTRYGEEMQRRRRVVVS